MPYHLLYNDTSFSLRMRPKPSKVALFNLLTLMRGQENCRYFFKRQDALISQLAAVVDLIPSVNGNSQNAVFPDRDRIYALKTWDKPPTIETYRIHPFMKQVDAPPEAVQEAEGRPATPQPTQKLAAESTSRRFGQLSDPRSVHKCLLHLVNYFPITATKHICIFLAVCHIAQHCFL